LNATLLNLDPLPKKPAGTTPEDALEFEISTQVMSGQITDRLQLHYSHNTQTYGLVCPHALAM